MPKTHFPASSLETCPYQLCIESATSQIQQFVLVTGGRIWHCFLPPMTHQIHAPVKKRLFSPCADDARLLRASRSDTFISIVFRMLVSTGRSARSYLSCSDTMKRPRTLNFKAFLGTWTTIFGCHRQTLDRTLATYGSFVKKSYHFRSIWVKRVPHLGYHWDIIETPRSTKVIRELKKYASKKQVETKLTSNPSPSGPKWLEQCKYHVF